MPRFTSVFVCQQCSYQSPSYLGRCPNCNSWNSFVEEVVEKHKGELRNENSLGIRKDGVKPIKLSEISADKVERTTTGMVELDRVLGGGIVPGMVVLLSGEPGIGKSTLLLELARNLGGNVGALHESPSQVSQKTTVQYS